MFDSQETLVKAMETVKQGTLSFVTSDQLLYIKTGAGWRAITVLSISLFVCLLFFHFCFLFSHFHSNL